MFSESDTRFYIGASTVAGAGDGLFAAEPLQIGDRLHVIGVLVDRDSAADRCTGFADAHKIRVGNSLLIPVGWAAKVNHHDDPNVRKVIDGDDVFLEVVRRVVKDEEIFFRYHDYATNRFHPK
jgi:hypothetical protein